MTLLFGTFFVFLCHPERSIEDAKSTKERLERMRLSVLSTSGKDPLSFIFLTEYGFFDYRLTPFGQNDIIF